MYDRGYARKTILELFRVIDWMLQLPAGWEAAFRQDLYAFEESKQMPYVTTVERAGIEKGLQQGLQQGEQIGYRKGEVDLLLWQIEKKFGADAVAGVREIVSAADDDALRLWSERILTADSVEAVFQ